MDYPEVSPGSIRSAPRGPDPQYAIGVRVTADHLIGLLLDLNGIVVDLGSALEAPEGPGRGYLRAPLSGTEVAAVVADIAALAQKLLGARPDLGEGVLGIGVSIGGHVDGETGVVRFSPTLGWTGEVRLAELLERATGFDVVVVENDVNVLVDAEQWSGTAERYRRFAVVKVGTGIGCGLSLHRELERGATGAAGELGHIPFEQDGWQCICGNRGCLQTVASGDAILRAIQQWGRRDVDAIDKAADLARSGDETARMAFTRAGEALGVGLAILLNVINLEAVILCGDAVLLKYEPYVDAARQSLAQHAFSTTAEDCALLIEARTDELEARGAASMVLGHLADVRDRRSLA